MKYFIAYTNDDGQDFQGLPWLEGPFYTVDDVNSFIIECSDKMNDPVIFITPDIIEEEITWDYVREHMPEDLCKSCVHFWEDFPLPLDHFEPHCELLDIKGKLLTKDNVPFPCLKCPFDSYKKKSC